MPVTPLAALLIPPMRRIDDMRSEEEGSIPESPEDGFAAGPHVVHLYRTPTVLHLNVASWTTLALANGGGALLIGRPAHTARIRERLREDGLDPSQLELAGRLVSLDAATLLTELVRDGRLRHDAFNGRVARLLDGIRRACGSDRADVRAWGELVDILARRGDSHLAAELERAWNAIILREGVRLLCSYEVARLPGHAYAALLSDVRASHGWIACEESVRVTRGDANGPSAPAAGAAIVPPALAEGGPRLTVDR